ncbi:hypothetical protein CC117_15290 [Parafrankia colletiae]|uniref:Uncharacterized protein n=1 Tax=Parafrankia colletiae TaxID=573497 RepID=A0A1S1R0T3_9ACTN|nr:hypothetical protein CC117_15290 [Parafrankia colletiae]
MGIATGPPVTIQSVTRTSPGTTGTVPSGTMPPGANLPIRLTLTQVSAPSAASPLLQVSGSVLVQGTDRVTGLGIALDVGSAVRSRDDLGRLSQGERVPTVQYRNLAGGLLDSAGTMLGSPFRAEADVSRYVPPTGVAVHPVQIRVVGRVNGRAEDTVATATTFMVLSAPRVTARTQVLTVVPLASPPRLRSDGLLTDDGLRAEIAEGGGLRELLEAVYATAAILPSGPPTVALGVDPTLVQALLLMQEDYSFAAPEGPKAGRADPEAGAFLDMIKQYADLGGTVFALPYGDVDLPSLVHADQLDALQYSVNTGQTVIAELLGVDPQRIRDIAFPADGIVDAPTVNVLSANGAGTVIVDDELLPAARSVTHTPSAGVTLATDTGQIHALAADHRLADLVTGYEGSEADRGVALARFRAELAMITFERLRASRSASGSVVLALPRDASRIPQGWLAEILRTIESPYSTAIGIQAVTDPALDGTRQRAGLTYPEALRERELPVDYVDGVGEVRDKVQTLASLFCPATPAAPAAPLACQQTERLKNTLITGLSAAWRTDRPAGVSLVQQADGEATGFRDGVRVVGSQMVNLTSSRGRVPVTLENSTPWDVTVVLKIVSSDRGRLISAPEVARRLIAGQKDQIEIEVDAESAGTFPIDIRLETADGRTLGPEAAARVLVRSTVYGAIATTITVGAIGVLMVAVVVRQLRRLRAWSRQRALAGGAGSPDHPDPSRPDAGRPGPSRAGSEWADQATLPLRGNPSGAPERDPYPPGLDRFPHHPGDPDHGPTVPWGPDRPAAPAGSGPRPRRRDGR